MYMGMGVSGGEEGARNGTLCCTVCSAGPPMLFTHACWDAVSYCPCSCIPQILSTSTVPDACTALLSVSRAASHSLCLSMLQAPPSCQVARQRHTSTLSPLYRQWLLR